MSRKAMKDSLLYDLKAQLEKQMIDKVLHDKAITVINNFKAVDWKDIDDMSTVAAVDMVLDVARLKEGA
ncbi:hypothetical protein D3C73_905390 [compost metagenome]